MDHAHPAENRRGGRAVLVLIAFLAIAAFFLFAEHRAHLFGILPFLLLLACPFLHLFLHRGRGTHRKGDQG